MQRKKTMQESLNRLLKWLENLPVIILSFALGFREGTRKRSELKKKLLKSEVEESLAKRRLEVTLREIARNSSDSLDASIRDGSADANEEGNE